MMNEEHNDKITMCKICNEKPSTGVLIEMCDDCFDAFEKRVLEGGSEYELTESEVNACIYNPVKLFGKRNDDE